MLTGRGWVLFVAIVLLTGLGLAAGNPVLALVGITLLGWFLGQWLWFAVRLRLVQGNLRVERRVRHEHGETDCLWANTPFTVEIRVAGASRWPLPYVQAADRVPPLAEVLRGAFETGGPLAPQQPLTLRYRACCRTPGQIVFDGLWLAITDLQGLFIHARFLRDGRRLRVLPALVDARGRLASVKRRNQLPLLGHHVHRRPGSGSELLDLRDYLPGDPPKTIAWKASARRDRLMTKEFESEVPIRCTLFVDVSQSVRAGGPGNNALSRLVDIAAAVAQASAARRDLTGLCLCDDSQVRYVRPARGSRHLVQLMNLLAEAASAMPAVEVPVHRLLPLAYGLAQDLYPEFLLAENNAFPLWLPLWSPRPAYLEPRPPLPARARWTRPWLWIGRRCRYLYQVLDRSLAARFSVSHHRHYRWRKKLAAVLAIRYGLAPGGLALLLEDDEALGHYFQRFLAEHQVCPPAPYYDALGRYQFASPAKVEALGRAFLRAVGKGHDNELFVLLVDLLEVDDGLGKLLAAVKVGLARHHQVMVVCPWPDGMPLPPRQQRPADREDLDELPSELAPLLVLCHTSNFG